MNKSIATQIKADPISVILSAAPFFGGTTPIVSTVPAAGTPTAVASPGAQPGANGDATPAGNANDAAGGSTTDDPVAKLQADPNALSQLLTQVTQLQKDLEKANEKVGTFETKQQEEARKQQTREQQLESDLAQRDAIIQQMDAVLRNMAINTAILSSKDTKFHSTKQVRAELDESAFEIDVDLAKGTATVTGMDGEIKRVARDCPWLVDSAAKPNTPGGGSGTPPGTVRRPSGTPPAPPNGAEDKSKKRANLMSRFPVLASR